MPWTWDPQISQRLVTELVSAGTGGNSNFLCPQNLTDGTVGLGTKTRFIQIQGQLQVWFLVTGPNGHCSEFTLKHKAQHLQFENLKRQTPKAFKNLGWQVRAPTPPPRMSSAGQRAWKAVRVCEHMAFVHVECLNLPKHCPSTCSERGHKQCFRPPLVVDWAGAGAVQPARLQGQGVHTRPAGPWPGAPCAPECLLSSDAGVQPGLGSKISFKILNQRRTTI